MRINRLIKCLKINKEKIPVVQEQLELMTLDVISTADNTRSELNEYYDKLIKTEKPQEIDDQVLAKISSLKRASQNLKKAHQTSDEMADELAARWMDYKKSLRKKIIPNAPANSVIDVKEKNSNHFARGLNIYKLLWICFIGSFAGVIVELLWCLLTNGYLESRSGLVYGPFNLLYGVGAVALSAALYRYRNRGKWLSFLGGALVGSIVEYVCSFVQEAVFGSRSWDYSNMPFNLNGRICLLYSIFWGFLGVFWVKNLYPRMAELILKIPNKSGIIITWVLTAFFVFNSIVTCVSVYRWSERTHGIEAQNEFFEFIDERFPDERMEKIFANMKF